MAIPETTLSSSITNYIESHYTVLASSDPLGRIPQEPIQFFFLGDHHFDIATQALNAGLINAAENAIQKEAPHLVGRGQLLLECEPSMQKVADVASHQMSIGIEAPLETYGWDLDLNEIMKFTPEEWPEARRQNKIATAVKHLEYKKHLAVRSELDLDAEIDKINLEQEFPVVSCAVQRTMLHKVFNAAHSLSSMNQRLEALVQTVEKSSQLPGNKYFMMGIHHATNIGLYTIDPLIKSLNGKTFVVLQANTPKMDALIAMRPKNMFSAENREPQVSSKVVLSVLELQSKRRWDLIFYRSSLGFLRGYKEKELGARVHLADAEKRLADAKKLENTMRKTAHELYSLQQSSWDEERSAAHLAARIASMSASEEAASAYELQHQSYIELENAKKKYLEHLQEVEHRRCGLY